MDYLLDTHTALWMMYSPGNLPNNIRKILDDEENVLYVSAISVWEVGMRFIKNKNFKISGTDFYDDLRFNDIYMLPLKAKHIVKYEQLKIKEGAYATKDPFGRMLVAQSKHEEFILLSHDKGLSYYDEDLIQIY